MSVGGYQCGADVHRLSHEDQKERLEQTVAHGHGTSDKISIDYRQCEGSFMRETGNRVRKSSSAS